LFSFRAAPGARTQLPDDEKPRLVEPNPPRDVDEPEVDLKPTLPPLGLLVDLDGDSAVETEPEGRLDEVERRRS
jgi:hypothetical protein